MKTRVEWVAHGVAHIYVELTDVSGPLPHPILELSFVNGSWQTELWWDGEPLPESARGLEISFEDEQAIRDESFATATEESPGVREALAQINARKVDAYIDETAKLAGWGAAHRARAYARALSPQILQLAFKRLERMDRGACQECDRAIDWHDNEPGYECEYCGFEQMTDPVRHAIETLHRDLPNL